MGAESFTTTAEGTDLRAAFNTAVEHAQYDYGHAGYTGTIAEKDDVVVIESTPMSERDAENLANRLIYDGDPRIDNKWGPAGAIAIGSGTSTRSVEIPSRPEGFPTLRAAAEAALGALPKGQSITEVTSKLYEATETGRPCTGTLTATLSGGEHTGWLFFGWASS